MPSDRTAVKTWSNVMTVTYATLPRTGRASIWIGRVLSGLVILFMLFDGVTKLIKIQPVLEATTRLGFAESAIRPIGLAALTGAILYGLPPTATLGAVILTGFLGGAVAIQLRAGEPIFNCLFPIIFGMLAWLGLVLRDPGIRAVFPLRQESRQSL
jgi:hypothetical protein